MNKKLQHNRKNIRKHTEAKLLKRLRIFVIIIGIIFCVVLYKMFLGQLSIVLAVIGLTIGTVIGLISGRMYKIFWHEETQKVVSQLDKIGMIFLGLYIAVEVGKKWFFGHWLGGDELSTFGLIFLMGLLLGRLLSIVKNIKKVLAEEKKI